MLNLAILNSGVLGAGAGSRELVTGSAAQVVEAASSFRTSLTKAGRVASIVTARGVLRLTQVAVQQISGIAEGVGALAGHVLTRTYFAQVVAPLAAVGACRLSRRVAVPLATTTNVTGEVRPRIAHRQYAEPIFLVVGVASENSGIDIYVGPTPEDRVAFIQAVERTAYIAGV